MSSDTKRNGYLRVPAEDGSTMCWPDPTDPRELEWRLRYAPDSITRADQMALASLVSAYAYLISLDSKTRQRRVMQIRSALVRPT
jgi:hypothetical protein